MLPGTAVSAVVVDMSDDQPESAGRRWEARARVDYPLHYLIWLREHKILEEKLDTINVNGDPSGQVCCQNKFSKTRHRQLLFVLVHLIS